MELDRMLYYIDESSRVIFADNKMLINIFIVFFSIGLGFYMIRKFHLKKKQLFVFLLLAIFWSSIVIMRSYRKAFALADIDYGGLQLTEALAVSIIATNGLFSILSRFPIFIANKKLKDKRFILLPIVGLFFLSSYLVANHPVLETLYFSSIMIGIASSLVPLFNGMFISNFSRKHTIVAASILSIAPLVAEFIVAPFQYMAIVPETKNYVFLWQMSAVLSAIAFFLLLFYKEKKRARSPFRIKYLSIYFSNTNFMVICFLGFVLSFIKFASSGTNMVAMVQTPEINMQPFYIAYLDVIFAFCQLITGTTLGIYLRKKIGILKTLILGFLLMASFLVIACVTTNPLILFYAHALNGLGYGILYIILLKAAAQPFSKHIYGLTTTVYQTFYAVGIFYADIIYEIVLKLFNSQYTGIVLYHKVLSVMLVLTLLAAVITIAVFSGKNKDFIEKPIRIVRKAA